MSKNYLLTAFRHLLRHRVFSLLNIIGLTIGLAAAYLIFLYVRFERSYDNFHSKAARIYRLCCDEKTPTGVIHQGFTSAPMSIAAARAFPEIEAVVREDFQLLLVRRGALVFQEEHAAYVDSGFFEVFDFPLLKGDPLTALKAPLSVVLSESAVRKYFGKSDPMGQTLLIRDEGMAAKVTGIMKDMPENTELKADMLLSKSTTRLFRADEDKQWSYFGLWAYVLLKPNVDPQALEKKFQAIGRQFNSYGREGRIIGVMKDFNYYSLHYAISPLGMLIAPLDANLLSVQVSTAGLPGTMAAIRGVWKKILPDRPFSYYFEDEFFNRQYENDDRFGRLFFDFSMFAILISCLGLLGLASYSTLQKTKEIGIRKVLGASVAGIIRLLSGEFLSLVMLALAIAIPLVWLIMSRWLADYAYRISFPWWTAAAAGGLAMMIALLAIGFHTFRAALQNPAESLKTE